MARIGKKQAAQILRRVANKYGPDTKYEDRDARYEKQHGCRYVNRAGKPMCIVGVALVEELGVSPKFFQKENNMRGFAADLHPSSLWPDESLYGNLPELQALRTPSAAKVFQEAQDRQDVSASWGEAVKAATAGIR